MVQAPLAVSPGVVSVPVGDGYSGGMSESVAGWAIAVLIVVIFCFLLVAFEAERRMRKRAEKSTKEAMWGLMNIQRILRMFAVEADPASGAGSVKLVCLCCDAPVSSIPGGGSLLLNRASAKAVEHLKMSEDCLKSFSLRGDCAHL